MTKAEKEHINSVKRPEDGQDTEVSQAEDPPVAVPVPGPEVSDAAHELADIGIQDNLELEETVESVIEAEAEAILGEDAPATEEERQVRRWHWRLLRASVWMVSLISILAAIALYFGIGTRLDAPHWVRERIETRIERDLNGLQIEFTEIYMVVNKGWRPRVAVRDVIIRNGDGESVAQLADAEVSLAMRPMLRGQLQPKKIYLNGLYASVRREVDGVAISFSETGPSLRQARTVPELIEQWDSHFERPVLSALTEVSTENLTLRYEDARLGRVWTLDGGHLSLTREDADLTVSSGFSLLSGREDIGEIEANYRSKIGEPEADFGVLVKSIASEDIAVQSAGLGWLQVLRAPISGSMRGGVAQSGELLPLSASLQVGKGVIQPSAQAAPVTIEGARAYFTYSPVEQSLRFDELRIDSAWGAGTMEGVAHLSGVENGQLTELVGQLQFTNLTVNPPGFYEAPLKLSGVKTDFKLQPAPFHLQLGQLSLQQAGTRVTLDGEVSVGDQGWKYALNGQADQVTADQVKAFWPAPLSSKPRKWVQENLFAGVAKGADFALRGEGRSKPFVALNAGLSGVELKFQKHLPPLQDGAGHFSIYGNRLVAIATAGTVEADEGGVVDAAGTSFIIPDMSIKGGTPGIARVIAKGPVTAALSLLNRPPLTVMDKANLPVDLAAGQVSVAGSLSLPLKPKVEPEEIIYHYRGTVTNVRSEVLVPDRSVDARALELEGDQSRVRLWGEGRLEGIPVTADWQQAIGPGAAKGSRVDGEVQLSQEAVDRFELGLPKGSVSGLGKGHYSLILEPDEAPELTVTSDLAGVELRIPSLSWRKSAEKTGKLDVTATLGKTPKVEALTVEAPGLRAEGTVTFTEKGGMERASFSAVNVGNWLRGPVVFTGRGKAPPAISVTGGALDMRLAPFSGSSASSGGDSGPISMALDRLQVTDSIALTNFQGRFSTAGGFNGEFTARLNGQAAVSGLVVPQANGTATRIRSENAGGVFQAAGILRHGHGGSFDMTLLPARESGEYDGRIQVRNTRIKNAPAMAALVNALSLVGLVDELAGQGILFTNVEADFRLSSTHLILHKSSAIGASIGVSLDGVYDLRTSVLNMRGVISPIYLLNAIGAVLTRKGEGLIGFAFTLKGTADDPKVQVNPLSGLAPGMFREIFRGPKPIAQEAPLQDTTNQPNEPRAPTVQGGDK